MSSITHPSTCPGLFPPRIKYRAIFFRPHPRDGSLEDLNKIQLEHMKREVVQYEEQTKREVEDGTIPGYEQLLKEYKESIEDKLLAEAKQEIPVVAESIKTIGYLRKESMDFRKQRDRMVKDYKECKDRIGKYQKKRNGHKCPNDQARHRLQGFASNEHSLDKG